MPVTIGDFEVVPDAPAAPAPSAAAPTVPASPDPLDLQRQLQALQELALRCWAH